MRITIDIPESLYKRAKIRAVETGRTLKDLVVASLERSLGQADITARQPVPYWARRQLLPEYKAALKAGAFSGGTDSVRIISEDREGR